MDKDKWAVEGGAKCYEKCSHIEHMPKHEIVLSQDLWNVLRAMCLKFPTREWQMLLTGTRDVNGCLCTGYIIPKQATSAAYVEHKDDITKEMIETKHIVCGIHSHVNMSTTPSSTDINDSVMSLIDYHIIMNNRYECNGMRKAQLPCGGLSVVPCAVLVEGLVELEKIKIEGLENITERTYANSVWKDAVQYNPAVEYWNRYSSQEEREMSVHLIEGDY